jgi:hypothetical protein
VPRVTVSIPTHDTPPALLDRAIRAVLAQTFTDFKLIVVVDGGPDTVADRIHSTFDDPRLEVVALPDNAGRYAADVTAVGYAKSTWWAPHDADDAAEPDWLETLLANSKGVDAVFAPQWVHPIAGTKPVLDPVQRWDGTDAFRWHAHLAGLWRVQWLRETGIMNPHARVAWDQVMTSAVFLAGRVAVVNRPLYHRHRRNGSLTASRSTGWGSPTRREAARIYEDAWKRMVADPHAIGDIVDKLAPIEPLHASARTIKTERWGGWKLDPTGAAELDRRLFTLKPKTVVEFGSGVSTEIIGRYAAATGAKAISLEHDPAHLALTERRLRHARLGGVVDVRHAPLADTATGPMYDTVLPDGIDFALIDGPPTGTGGRAATFPALRPLLAPRWEVWLDDGDRREEQDAVAAWLKADPGIHVHASDLPKNVVRLSSHPMQPKPVDASDVIVTVLTGRRPRLFDDTISHLPPGLLESARVFVLANGGDTPTLEVIEDLGLRQHATVITTHSLLSLGDAVTLLVDQFKGLPQPYWFHLEDDWRFVSFDETWLGAARAGLESPAVAQVRLRHTAESVLTKHMVTGRRIRWEPHHLGLIADTHLTTNPSLVRTVDATKMWPADGEKDMQRRAWAAGMRTVIQTHPGGWLHTGDMQSLRLETGCPA